MSLSILLKELQKMGYTVRKEENMYWYNYQVYAKHPSGILVKLNLLVCKISDKFERNMLYVYNMCDDLMYEEKLTDDYIRVLYIMQNWKPQKVVNY
jgi:hypothetical protein